MDISHNGKEAEGFADETHRDFWLPLLSDYIDGTLLVEATARLKVHLGECAQCSADLEGLQQTVNLLNRLPELSVPRSFALTPAQVRRLKPSPFYRVSQWGAAIAATFLVFAFVLDFAGTFKTQEVTLSVAISTTAPAPTLPALGTLPPSETKDGSGSVVGAGGVAVSPNSTAVPDPTAVPVQTPVIKIASKSGLEPINIVQIVLVIALVLFATFAFALRPRSPADFALKNH